MLTKLRDAARTTVAKVFLVLISLAVVAGLGFGGYFGNLGARTVLAVGNTEISAQSFQLALQRQLSRLSQQLGTGITMEQARMFGLERQLLSQLASEAALNSETERLRIGVSDDRLAQRIAADPLFSSTGGFNRQFFSQVLLSLGLTEEEFVEDTRDFAARQQLAEGLVGGFEPPNAMLEVANTFANELRTVRYLTLAEGALDASEPPGDEELRAFFNERVADYRAPEFRAVRYIELSEATLADPTAIAEDEVREAFEAEIAVRAQVGERSITQLLFQDASAAADALSRLQGGATVAELQGDQGLSVSVTELGSVARSSILEEAAGDAAFSLQAPGPTQVIEGRFGSIIMVVNAIQSEEPPSFEVMEATLRQELASARARDDLFSIFDAIEDARAAGDTLGSIAERFSLQLTDVDALDSNGFGADGAAVPLPQTRNLLEEIFLTDVGLENDVIDATDGGFVWFEVTQIDPARDRSFEEAQERVRTDYLENNTSERLRTMAEGLVEELERGRSLETLAIALEQEVRTTAPFTRGEAPDELGGPATVAAFEGAEGHRGSVEGPDGTSRLVFEVTDVARPAFFETATDVQELREQLGPALEDTIVTQYVGALQADLGVRVNQELLNQLLTGGLVGGHAGM
ncbi:MAG: SurA N-terminal domain-containing protein [Pseudomonadota bacterium]